MMKVEAAGLSRRDVLVLLLALPPVVASVAVAAPLEGRQTADATTLTADSTSVSVDRD